MSPITKPTTTAIPFTVGVALDGAGWHPAAWRDPGAQPDALFSPEYWTGLLAAADHSGLDYVSIEDALTLQGEARHPAPGPIAGIVSGRLDALLTASWTAPRTSRIGIIPTVTTTHTEPFHVATALQTLDHVSGGRAGWQLKISGDAAAAAAFGRRPAPVINRDRVRAGLPEPALTELLDEAGDVTEVARSLWDSWEHDAIIRDEATGRFLDRDRVHHINFEGEHFSVTGPSIVPRSPQGQLPITLLAHSPAVYALAARGADVVFVTPGTQSAADIIGQVRTAEHAAAADRAAAGLAPLRIVADLVVALDHGSETGSARLTRLDRTAGIRFANEGSDARVVAGSAASIAAEIAALQEAGVNGVRLRPLTLPADLAAITRDLLPVLAERGIHTPDPNPTSLRTRFGLDPAANRYAASPPGGSADHTPANTAAQEVAA